MPSGHKKKPKGLPKRTGRRKDRRARYYAGNYLRNKLRRILDANGVEAADRWSAAHHADWALREVVQRKQGAFVAPVVFVYNKAGHAA